MRTLILCYTTLQSMMNAKLSPHRFWPCYENRLIKTIQTIHSQPFITSNRPKLGIDFGLHLLILATFDPSSNILRVGFHDRPP